MTTPARVDPELELLYFNLFDDCNAKCNMCDCWLAASSRRDIEFYLQRLQNILGMRPRAIRFTGGEPLLLPDLARLVDRAASEAIRVSIITNGRLLEAKARTLADAGCTEMVVSIDGNRQTHDSIRGTPGLFAHLVRGLDALTDTEMIYGVNTVVQQQSVGDLMSMSDFLLTRNRRPSWWHLIPVRDCPDLALAPDGMEELAHDIRKIRVTMKRHDITLIADEAMFDPDRPQPCSVPSFAAYVRADNGLMFGCNMLAHAGGVIGNTLTEGLAQAWNGAAAHGLRVRCATGENPACARCDGGSREMNHHLRGLARQGNRDRAISEASRLFTSESEL